MDLFSGGSANPDAEASASDMPPAYSDAGAPPAYSGPPREEKYC